VEPKVINGNIALLLKLVGPLPSVLVLDILPFWADAGFEEMVVGFEGEFGGGCDIVLYVYQCCTEG
jgi:hypothetical protein